VKDKITKLLIIVLICVVVYKIADVYAAYKSMIEEKLQGNIEPWIIFVNDTDIVKSETATFNLVNMISDSEYTKAGKIAPGTKVQIPVEIDVSGTKNLDIRYDVILDGISNEQSVLKIENIIEKNTNASLIRTEVNTYTGIINADSLVKKHDLNISLIWENNEELNERDTKLGTSKQKMTEHVSVTVSVSQYMNEKLNNYSE